MNELLTVFPTTEALSCPLFSECSGCTLRQGLRFPPVSDRLQIFFLSKGVNFSWVAGDLFEYRSKAKLAVRKGSEKTIDIGLFAKDTHRVVNMPCCPMHYPAVDEVLELFRKKAERFGIDPYRESPSSGRLRYVQFASQEKQGPVQVVAVFFGEHLLTQEREFLEDLHRSSPVIHSVWANFHPGSGNSVFGSSWEKVAGEEDFLRKIGGIEFSFPPGSFSQIHIPVFEKMLSYIESKVPSGKNILELYSGVGCIGLTLAKQAKRVFFVESSPYAKEGFERTLSRLEKEIADHCHFFCCDAENLLEFEETFDVVIVDPPRKGLSKKCKEKIIHLHPPLLIYVSCGTESFLRDCRELEERGYVLSEAAGFLLFPGTDHAEIVAVFSLG